MPEMQNPLTDAALILGIVLTIILTINALLDMPAKIRNLRALWRK